MIVVVEENDPIQAGVLLALSSESLWGAEGLGHALLCGLRYRI
jgi:hypothetical protein